MKKLLRKKSAWVFFAVILVALLVYFFRQKNGKIDVIPYTVTNRDVLKTVTSSGKTAANQNLEVKSLVAGQVAKVNFNSGDQVKEGEVILVYDKNSLNASAATLWNAYLTAKATKDSFQSQLNAAEKDLEEKRYRRDTIKNDNKDDSGYSTKDAINTAQSSVEDAGSALRVLQDKKDAVYQAVNSTYLSYLSAQKNLSNSEVKAPATGYLALDSIVTGTSVIVGQELFKISNSNFMQFVAEVDETDISFLKVGQEASITLDAYPNTDFTGTVLRLDSQTHKNDSGGTVIDAILDLSLGDVRPLIGTNGTADISIEKKVDQLAVPLDTVLYDDDKNYYVFKIENDTTVLKQLVKIGFEGDEDYVITDGLQDGDIIAIGDNFSKLTDGAKISVNKNK